MAREVNRLSARQIASLKAEGRYPDGDGLYLVVDKNGSKRWSLLAKSNGKRHEYGLGGLRSVSLAEAREAAKAYKVSLRAGVDPRVERQAIPTFDKLARQWIEDQAPTWRGRDTKTHWERSLLIYAKALGPLPVDKIETEHVLGVLQPYWLSRPESGRKLRQRIEAVLDVALVRGWRSGANPARMKGHMEKILPRQSTAVSHRRAVDYHEAPSVMRKLADSPAMSARALEWTILTAARESMTRLATWGEIDGDVWTLSGDRMKGQGAGEFRIPLSRQALDVLALVRPDSPAPDQLLFPGLRNRPMSDQTMDSLLTRLNIDATPHGFRSTFRDWAGDETDHARDVAEMALAHTVGTDTERAYRRKNAFEKRRILMQDWADFIRPRPDPADA